MSYPPFAYAESLCIGTVDFVSPDEVEVLLDTEAPDSVALNAGSVRPFPRINSYVLVPVDDNYLVGQIEWITVEHSAFPRRKGTRDFGLIDLPYPLRKMKLNPLGVLSKENGKERNEQAESYIFQRGTNTLPSVGTPVLLPTEKQLRSIIESGELQHIEIGVSPLAANASVSVNPDRLFGRHLAVLGNTGSGKSCSIAGLIRWSLEAARDKCEEENPNARFIVLDPNGEYARAFKDSSDDLKPKIFAVGSRQGDELALKVPLWFWNSAEWLSFTQASAGAQRPLLKRALREIKGGSVRPEPDEGRQKLRLRHYLSATLIHIQNEMRFRKISAKPKLFGEFLKATSDDLSNWPHKFPSLSLESVCENINKELQANLSPFQDKTTGETVNNYRAFNEQQISPIVESLKDLLEKLGGIIYQQGPDEDMPTYFRGEDFADHLEFVAERENVSQHLDFLVSRIRTLLSDARISPIIRDDDGISLEQWLSDYLGRDSPSGEQLVILDLSLVPTEVVHVVTAVAARMIFEALQRHRKLSGKSLPTVLVMEEAHTFIKRYRDNFESQDTASMCCQVFERIAREGRKFGVSLVLSSQRPSELSPTVLSQCNTFLLHRLSNDRDQELVRRLVPDNIRGLLRELPSLPSQYAILLGWASELPVIVKLKELTQSQRPHSDDPEYWKVWTTGVRGHEADWKRVAEDWQNLLNVSDSGNPKSQ